MCSVLMQVEWREIGVVCHCSGQRRHCQFKGMQAKSEEMQWPLDKNCILNVIPLCTDKRINYNNHCGLVSKFLI